MNIEMKSGVVVLLNDAAGPQTEGFLKRQDEISRGLIGKSRGWSVATDLFPSSLQKLDE